MNVFINPGHAPSGIPDPGAVNPLTGLRECDVVLAVGTLVDGYLRAAGCATQLLQSDLLGYVVGAANSWGADVFVSIHCNSAANTAAQGTETWYCHGSLRGKVLAECIQQQIVTSLPVIDRGLKEATPGVNGLYVLSNTDMPAALVELAFISNPDDECMLADPAAQDEFARAIARGITDYFAKGGL
ncbi:N-acetylmuramoyl-L-alanine amidase LytC [Sporomusa carbonis]|uniref:N-acetylmuramoyl-L-alanine amidase family protein n=1 Tax=Sporomusa carbonis TaxID=3076075 RepID=UPI003A6F04E7